MTVRREKRIKVGAGHDHIGVDYSTDIFQQDVQVEVGKMKIIQHPDGKGFTLITRPDNVTFTIVTKRYQKGGLMNKDVKKLIEVIEYKKDGAYLNGRKLWDKQSEFGWRIWTS